MESDTCAVFCIPCYVVHLGPSRGARGSQGDSANDCATLVVPLVSQDPLHGPRLESTMCEILEPAIYTYIFLPTYLFILVIIWLLRVML